MSRGARARDTPRRPARARAAADRSGARRRRSRDGRPRRRAGPRVARAPGARAPARDPRLPTVAVACSDSAELRRRAARLPAGEREVEDHQDRDPRDEQHDRGDHHALEHLADSTREAARRRSDRSRRSRNRGRSGSAGSSSTTELLHAPVSRSNTARPLGRGLGGSPSSATVAAPISRPRFERSALAQRLRRRTTSRLRPGARASPLAALDDHTSSSPISAAFSVIILKRAATSLPISSLMTRSVSSSPSSTRHAQQPARLRVERRLPQHLRHHLAEALEARDLRACALPSAASPRIASRLCVVERPVASPCRCRCGRAAAARGRRGRRRSAAAGGGRRTSAAASRCGGRRSRRPSAG